MPGYRFASLLATVGLISGACSSDPEVAVAPDPVIEQVDPARGSRAAQDPKGSRTLGEPGPVTIVHAIGSLGAIPDTSGWPDALPMVTDDLATVTALECEPFTEGCEVEEMIALALGDIDIVSLATSNADIAGAASLSATAAVLSDLEIGTPGYGANAFAATAPVLVISEGNTLALHAISFASDLTTAATVSTPGIAGPDSLDALLDAVALSHASDHLVVVSVDWGSSDERAPGIDQIAYANEIIEAGADAIIGHGPTALQRMERIESAPVAFSLGQAVTPEAADGAVLRLVFGSALEDSCLLPATSGPAGPALDTPEVTDCR